MRGAALRDKVKLGPYGCGCSIERRGRCALTPTSRLLSLVLCRHVCTSRVYAPDATLYPGFQVFLSLAYVTGHHGGCLSFDRLCVSPWSRSPARFTSVDARFTYKRERKDKTFALSTDFIPLFGTIARLCERSFHLVLLFMHNR